VDELGDRQHERNPAKLEVRITTELGGCLRGTVQDVSLAGLFVVCAQRIPVGTLCELCVEVVGCEGEGPIEAVGRVAHVEPDGIGIEITDLDLDHYQELRRLVTGRKPGDA